LPAPPSLLRLLTFLVTMLAPLAAFATDEPAPVGFVDKVENEAKVVSGDSGATAIIGTPVHMKDELRTGAEGRLQVTFRDNTVLTLGEKASVVIDRYVYAPDRDVGETVLQRPRASSGSPLAASRA